MYEKSALFNVHTLTEISATVAQIFIADLYHSLANVTHEFKWLNKPERQIR